MGNENSSQSQQPSEKFKVSIRICTHLINAIVHSSYKNKNENY